MNSLISTIKYFLFIMSELAVLFIGISTIVALVLMYIPQDKMKNWMAGKGILGNILGVLFGAVTPFCACSTVPITLGLLKAGVPFGTVISFVIASPLMDPSFGIYHACSIYGLEGGCCILDPNICCSSCIWSNP